MTAVYVIVKLQLVPPTWMLQPSTTQLWYQAPQLLLARRAAQRSVGERNSKAQISVRS